MTMQQPNENGVYEPTATEELARRGRSYAAIRLCQCEDGLYRYALDMTYSYGGFCGPIFKSRPGFISYADAKAAGAEELLRQFPKAWASEPQSVHDELREMKTQIEQHIRQPSLF